MRKLSIRVPASSGNLGPGFDALALAFELYCRIDVEVDGDSRSGGPYIKVAGRHSAGLPENSSNLVLQIIADILGDGAGTTEKNSEAADLLARTSIKVTNDIPLARGLGSSSAASCGAFYCARWLQERDPGRDEVIQHVASMEGHAENSAASVLGGVVVVARRSHDGFEAVSTSWPAQWATVVVVPPHEVSTPVARKILPRTVGLKQAVANIQNTALLMTAINKGDPELLRISLKDFIHEPYRESLVPELTSLRSSLRYSPALGVVLSGAGSSVLVVSERSGKEDLLGRIAEWQERYCPGAEILDLKVDRQGLVVESA
ncbi:MAG: homoserine kinase [Candidatus Obscuribacterales bacterium]